MPEKSRKEIIREKKVELFERFNDWREEVNDLVKSDAPSYEINNKIIEMRNQSSKYIESALSEIAIQKKYGEVIKVPVRDDPRKEIESYGKPCQICGEKRVHNICHVIPSIEGGPNRKGNFLTLCPTHHFLLDHARLSKDEFESIETSHLLPESKQYLENVHRKRHQMRWKYQTNRFDGCDCGSMDFEFDIRREKSSVSVVLICQECNETWLNLWQENHPISKLSAYAYEVSDDEDVDDYLDQAEEKAKRFINNELDSLLNGNEW